MRSWLQVLFNFIQVTGFLGAFDMDWPGILKSMFASANSGLGFGFNFSFINCALVWSAYVPGPSSAAADWRIALTRIVEQV